MAREWTSFLRSSCYSGWDGGEGAVSKRARGLTFGLPATFSARYCRQGWRILKRVLLVLSLPLTSAPLSFCPPTPACLLANSPCMVPMTGFGWAWGGNRCPGPAVTTLLPHLSACSWGRELRLKEIFTCSQGWALLVRAPESFPSEEGHGADNSHC